MGYTDGPSLSERLARVTACIDTVDRHLATETVIEDGRTRNYLLRSGARTVDDIIRLLDEDARHPVGGLTTLKKTRIYESLLILVTTPKESHTDDGRRMFADTLPEYDTLSQRSLNLMIKDRRPIRKLLDAGYKKVGSLKGIPERTLAGIVGEGMMPRFYVIEEKLIRKPEEWLPEIWQADIKSRRGRIVDKSAHGQTRSSIAAEEGVTVERIRQMTEKFFLGQDPFLEIIEEKISRAEEQDSELLRVLPNENERNIYLVWRMLKAKRRGHS